MHWRISAAALGLLLLVGSALGRGEQPAPEDLSLRERAYIASKLYSAIQMYFAHWESIPGFDLDRAYQEYLGQALQAEGCLEFDLATMEFLGRLRNGHTHFQDRWLYETYGQSLGFYASPAQGKWVVMRSASYFCFYKHFAAA